MADKQAVQQLWRPFVVGARDTQRPDYTATKALTATTQKLDPYKLSTIGFVSAVYIYVSIAASNPGGAVVALQEDAPWSIFDSLTLYDVGSKPIGGSMSGADWFEVIKHGGYTICDDERGNTGSTYTALTTGAGATAGSGTFCLRIPVAINKRNGLGAIVNKNAGSTLRIEANLGALSAIYSTAPSAGATATITMVIDGYLDAATSDTRGNPVHAEPPGGDTTQFLTKHSYAVNASSTGFKIKYDPVDGPVRSLLHIFRTTAAGTRAAGDAAWAPQSTIRYENLDPWVWTDWFWRRRIASWFDYRGTPDAARARSNGVYPFIFFDDFGLRAGVENGFKYLPVSSQVNMSIEGAWSAAGNLDVIVNKIYPGNADPLTLTGGR